MSRYDKRDLNENSIVRFWQGLGAMWTPQKREAGFDGLLAYRERLYIVEIKQPSERNRLTQNERETRDCMVMMGIAYNVVTSIEEAAELIGAKVSA